MRRSISPRKFNRFSKSIASHAIIPRRTKAGLNLESPQSMLKGGDSGPSRGGRAKAPKACSSSAPPDKAEPLMPPEGNKANATPLSSEELGLVKLWIDQGATGTTPSPRRSIGSRCHRA